jgi:hypothetical protein
MLLSEHIKIGIKQPVARTNTQSYYKHIRQISMSGGELLEIRLLDNHLLDTFGSKSTARHKIYQLLESS